MPALTAPNTPTRRLTVLAAACALAAPALAHNELQVARNAANQLVPHMDFVEGPRMEPNTFPEVSAGWISVNVGVSALEFDEPAEDAFSLSELSNIEMILVAQDPGLVIYRQLIPMNIGESFHLGNPVFHQHPLWGRMTGELGDVGSFTLRFHDISGTYADSEPFSIAFTNVPAPGTAMLGALSLGLAGARRRRR